MATLPATVSRICDDLSRPEAEIGASVQREILSAIEHYASERFAFNERTLAFTLSSTDTYQLSAIAAVDTEVAEVLGVDRIRVNVSNRYITLERIGWGVLQDLRDSPSILTGNPTYWAVFNKAVAFESIPNTSLAATMEVHVRLQPLDTATNTENAWLQEGRELIAARASAMVCRKKLQDFELAAVHEGIEQGEYMRLIERATKMTASGVLRGRW